MKNAQRHLATTFALLAPLAAQAAGPFSVLRTTSPRDVATAAPAAVVAVSPFEDASGFLLDGSNYFYSVRDASGTPLRVSVIANPALKAVRVSFDDGDPGSAPVGAAASSIALSPASIPADGVSRSIVTIVPRDANGVVLGTGLTVRIESTALWPGVLDGAIRDLGDGTYVATILSSLPGAGSVRVRVEGVTLAVEPMISYLDAGTFGSAREQARDMVASLASGNGPLADLEQSGGPTSASFASARYRLQAAATGLSPGNPERDKQDVMRLLDAAIGDLMAAAVTDRRALLLVDGILDAGRLLAVYHLGVAETFCGVCEGLRPRKTCMATAAIDEGDALQFSDPVRAIKAYTRAVDAGVQSRTTCS